MFSNMLMGAAPITERILRMSLASRFETLMLELINQERADRGLNPLALNGRLNDAAETHTQWMLADDVFSHTGEGGSTPSDRMRAAGYVLAGSWASGENIAWQSARGAAGIADDVANLHAALMNSPGHRANILSTSYTEIGLGIETGLFRVNGTNWDAVMVTQNFARSGADNRGDGSDQPPALAGDTAANAISGAKRAELLDGRAGDDRLDGRGGNDSLYGGAGDDTLSGGAGDDLMHGGEGSDRFIFAGAIGADRIQGFADNQDTLVFRAGVWDAALTATAFVDTYARLTATGVAFVFAEGTRIDIAGATSVAQFYDDVVLG
jgi:uncharacterized protein YkwD